MPYLETHLKTLDFSNQLNAVRNLIETAQAKTTFWGSRVVEVNGFTGSVYLDSIVEKIQKAGKQRFDAHDLSLAERIDGIEITKKLEHFYRITDTQIRNSNLFTKLLNWVQEFLFSFYRNTRFFFDEDRPRQYFCAYSKANFLQQFGGAFDARDTHPACHGFIDSWVIAKEDLIQNLQDN